jgi:AAA15 family ATPase/GTPase
LVKACKQYDVQLFATTHSLEAIDSILSAFLESKEVQENTEEWEEILKNLVTYRLVQKDTATLVKRFSGEELADIRYDFGQDVR